MVKEMEENTQKIMRKDVALIYMKISVIINVQEELILISIQKHAKNLIVFTHIIIISIKQIVFMVFQMVIIKMILK